ncbi:type II toxin-antitoxin system antitoxin SocA domain-containing protein [Viridibacillus arvi]|uniref:type II toxin-antitoxin system antitoxin SocA domain-containing protein n=1 Tax=Viridibacillus arvi TaxID=263475 RepID=UPI0034D004B2
MKKLCLECCRKTDIESDYIMDKAVFHNGKEVIYQAEIYRCTVCKNEVPSNELFDKNIENSICAFKKQYNMLTADEFKYIRETVYEVSIRTMASLIGCSPATISKYENGALQSKQHDLLYKQLISPKNMLNLYKASKDELKSSDREKLEERLEFLLKAVKVDELLKGLETHLELPYMSDKFEENNSSLTVAQLEDYFILKGQLDTNNDDEDIDFRISNLKLQKMMYYAQGWYMAITDTDLIPNEFEAWQHGPVVTETYHKYKINGAKPINISSDIDSFDRLKLSSTQLTVLNWVWEKYSHFDAKYLEYLTHKEDPWLKTRGGLSTEAKCNWIIRKSEIRTYFKNIYLALRILNKKLENSTSIENADTI